MCLGCLCKPLHFAAICTLGSAGSVVWYCEWMWVHMSLKVDGCARCFAKCIVSFDATWQYRFSFLHLFCNSFVLSWPDWPGHATGRPASSEQHLPPASAHRPKPQMLRAATIRCRCLDCSDCRRATSHGTLPACAIFELDHSAESLWADWGQTESIASGRKRFVLVWYVTQTKRARKVLAGCLGLEAPDTNNWYAWFSTLSG